MSKLAYLILLIISPVIHAGYDVHITKKEFYFNEGECITLAEWQSYMKTDPSVIVDPQNSEQGFIVSINKQVFPLWYSYDSCDLTTKNPSLEAITKMIEIAKRLNATVQGDEAEIYIAPDNVIRK
ncbi:hypothetical protein GPS63_05450 [Acinetobacter haemolyticus]|uniref:Uncharacterized protein n=2 Tax=Acinetobacter haemolyticus TaxID=29430 RepID=A0AAJ2YS73_ACIHA|nr:hypothetical protein [Acinetobacter haemolyticus]EFF82325.1 hypothetical protein HMP0015_2248 [Acinetobacter haemolyticus ATCC 19194]NAR17756.1 hypothetical protein [Acinetobacter haemolyticus]NAR29255.1 hypothetical protein [Acinetobacter haemolyticus]NAR35661.1 hypothetical protein [Acinetobacter haemolyticus]NAR48016.1 hypothetical protein [Acinetobacter haemolyticus]